MVCGSVRLFSLPVAIFRSVAARGWLSTVGWWGGGCRRSMNSAAWTRTYFNFQLLRHRRQSVQHLPLGGPPPQLPEHKHFKYLPPAARSGSLFGILFRPIRHRRPFPSTDSTQLHGRRAIFAAFDSADWQKPESADDGSAIFLRRRRQGKAVQRHKWPIPPADGDTFSQRRQLQLA